MTYAGADFWDGYFRRRRESGDDLDWNGVWTAPFLADLRKVGAHTVLELGCGTGNDAARLAREGYSLVAIDISAEAISHAAARFGALAIFMVADMAEPLPFAEASFDAVMSNVAMHMFPDRETRAVFAEVRRVVRPGGLFMFHLNALADRELRARSLPAREIEPDYVVEESGQTVHFFSDGYLRELLREWSRVRLESVSIASRKTGQPFKYVWRGVAYR